MGVHRDGSPRQSSGVAGSPTVPLDRPELTAFERFRAPRDLGPDEDYLQPVRAHIARFGWHIHGVFADPGRIGWHYTIGFGDTFGHPDLVVFGLTDSVAQILLNDIGDALASGTSFQLGDRYEGFLVDVDIEFRRTLPRWSPAHFGRARDWYGAYAEMWQVVLPDLEDRFPGDPGEEASRFQVLLANARPAPAPLTHEHTPIDVADGWTAIARDLVGGDETGWEELLVLVKGAVAERWVVVSVPFVDHIVFGDEVQADEADGELRVTQVTQRAPIATVRICTLRSGDETASRVNSLIDEAESNEILWESPVRFWSFFAVPHHRFEWFTEAAQPLVDDRLVSRRVVRPPGN